MATITKSLTIESQGTYNLTFDLWSYSEWAASAGITTSYASLAALIADEKAVRQLMTVHASVDYFANCPDSTIISTVINDDLCAKWINLRDYALDTLSAKSNIKSVMDTADKYGYGEWGLFEQVPVMTSNTAPYGTVTATNYYQSGREAYKAFNGTLANGSINNLWQSSDNTPQAYIQYEFSSATKIDEFYIHSDCQAWSSTITSDGSFSFKLQASNGSGFIDLTDVIELTANNYVCSYKGSIPKTNRGAYTTYRVQFVTPNLKYSASTSGSCLLDYVQFYQLGAKGNVPIMTANNAPYGTASMNGNIYTNYEPYKAFDNNQSTSWLAAYGSTVNSRLQYEFTAPICPKKAKVVPYTNGILGRLRGFKIQGYNGSTWEDLTSEISGVVTAEHEAIEVDITTNDYYTQLGLIVTQGSGDTGVESLQFYGRELTTKDLIPKMTSATTPSGTITASAESYGSKVNLFDKNPSSYWQPNNAKVANTWIRYDFPEPVKVNGCKYTGYSEYKLQYLDGNNNWVDFYNFTASPTSYTVLTDKVVVKNEEVEAKSWRLYEILQVNIAQYANELYLLHFGPDYSEKEFAPGSTRKTIYDHGVAPSGAITGGTKNPDCLTLSAVGTATVTIDKGTRKYMGGKAGLHASGTNRLKCGSGYSAFTASNMPDSNGFDISSISGSVAVGIEQTASGTFDCTEIWIE